MPKQIESIVTGNAGFIKSKNLSHEIADLLSDRIIRMEYKPGDRITESKIAKELNVSQSSVREALRILEQSGLVEINQRRGTYVTELSIGSITMLYDLMAEIYALLLRKAMEKQSPAHIQKLMNVFAEIMDSAEKKDVDHYFKSIFNLVLVTVEITESALLKKVITDLWQNKRRLEYMALSFRKNELKENLEYFGLLASCLNNENANPEQMVDIMKGYIRNEKEFAISLLKSMA